MLPLLQTLVMANLILKIMCYEEYDDMEEEIKELKT